MLLADFLQTVYLRSRIELTEKYVGAIVAVVRDFGIHLGREALVADLTDANVCDYLRSYRQHWSARSTNDRRATLLTLWRAAWEEGLTETLPRRVRRIPEEHDPPEAWTLAECERLFSEASRQHGKIDGVEAGAWWLSLCLTVYWTSARISALRATPTDCYTSGEGLLVRKQKNRKPQWFHLPPTCCDAIDATRPQKRKLIWPWPYCPRYFWTRFRRIVEAAGLPSPKTGRHLFHRLRRTSISLCASVDPVVAQRQAGHSDYRTTLASYVDPRICAGQTAADILPVPSVQTQLRIFA